MAKNKLIQPKDIIIEEEEEKDFSPLPDYKIKRN
jgi:hypothetical protein